MSTTTSAVCEFFDRYARSRSALDLDLIASQALSERRVARKAIPALPGMPALPYLTHLTYPTYLAYPPSLAPLVRRELRRASPTYLTYP